MTRRLPSGLLGMLCLVAACEAVLAGHSADLMSDAPFAWRWADKAATRGAVDSEILCLGDSLVKFGIAPRVVEGRTGRSTWNLAVTGGRPANSYFLLKHALDAGARPAALILDTDLLPSDPYEIPYLWPQLAGPAEVVEMAWVGGNSDFLAYYALAWALPSVRGRFELRNLVCALLNGGKTDYRALAATSDRNWKANRGAFIMPATHQLPAASVQFLDTWPEDKPRPGRWSSHPVNTVYLDKILDLAAARGIEVFWILPPHYRMFDRYYDQPNWYALQRRFTRDRLERHPNVVVIDGTHGNYARDVVMDVSHLNRVGAVAFSTALGDIVRERLSRKTPTAPRWLDLPAYASPAGEGPVEDLAQTINRAARRR